MCGIAGLIDFSSPEPKERLLRRMLGLIGHRGPDAFGIYSDSRVGLASTRLRIIDLSGGDQPIHNEDESVWVVYNGEIFNYPEIREKLESRGHRFYTRSDTEILVHLYEDHGGEFFQFLNGQFAFAIWDRRKERLLLGRDRLGIRPLFFHLKNERLVFGSEIKALFADSHIPRAIDRTTLSDIFTCWAPLGGKTPFVGVQQLLPGHYAVFSKKGLSSRCYWRLSFSRGQDGDIPLTSRVGELENLMLDATRIRLRADVPVGAYLSGGLDSTFITSMVKKHFNNRLSTFSVSFSDQRFDEAPFQQKAVEVLGTENKRIRCTEEDIGRSFPGVIWHTEVPLLRTAPVPLFQLSQLVRENHFKVVLTGEGSDEIFAGYDIFKEDRIRRFWARQPNSKMRPLLLQRLYPDIFHEENHRTGAFLTGFFRKGLSRVDSQIYSHLIRWENTAQIKSFFAKDWVENPEGENGNGFVERFLADLPADFPTWDPLSRAQYTEITVFLSNYLLSSQGDRVAMAHAVEGRFPFLDYRVVEFACALPPRFRLNGLQDKFILRKAAANLIPREMALRPKQPYRAPISRCFFGEEPEEYVSDLLSEKSLKQTGFFDPLRVRSLVEKCRKQDGRLLSERENMALVGILSTQLLDYKFIRNFPANEVKEPAEVKVFKGGVLPKTY